MKGEQGKFPLKVNIGRFTLMKDISPLFEVNEMRGMKSKRKKYFKILFVKSLYSNYMKKLKSTKMVNLKDSSTLPR